MTPYFMTMQLPSGKIVFIDLDEEQGKQIKEELPNGAQLIKHNLKI